MKICVYGAGAVGGNLAVRLMSLPDNEVSVIARGSHLQAIRAHGLKLVSPEGETVAKPAAATSQPAELPPQDIVFVTLKSHAQADAGRDIAGLLKPDGVAVFINNGVPWWWHHGLPGQPHHLALVDANQNLWAGLGASRCLGGVVYSMNEVIEPGVIRHRGNNRWPIGEPGNQLTRRLENTVSMMQRAGIGAEATTDIRHHILTKLLRNAALNPVCAVTRLDVHQVGERPDLALLCRQLSGEVAAVANAMGWNLDDALAGEIKALQPGGVMNGPKVSGTRPSMLQDVLAARPTEIDAILGEAQQFARTAGVATPAIDVMYSLVKGLDLALQAG